eukprot:3937118-Rhodomonas_salina.3
MPNAGQLEPRELERNSGGGRKARRGVEDCALAGGNAQGDSHQWGVTSLWFSFVINSAPRFVLDVS